MKKLLTGLFLIAGILTMGADAEIKITTTATIVKTTDLSFNKDKATFTINNTGAKVYLKENGAGAKLSFSKDEKTNLLAGKIELPNAGERTALTLRTIYE